MVSLILLNMANVDGLGTLRILRRFVFRFNKENKNQASTLNCMEDWQKKNAAGFMTKAFLPPGAAKIYGFDY
jgi:hypothetical protein